MKRGKRIFYGTILICLVGFIGIATFYCGNAKEKGIASLNDKDAIEMIINNYFKEYFRSLDKLEKPNFRGVLEDNIDNKLYIAANEAKVEQYKVVNLSYKNIIFNLNFPKFNIEYKKAEIESVMRCEFNYSSTLDVQSIITTKYSFNLKKDNGKWIIIKMDTDLDDYRLFKEMVNNKNKQNISNREKNIDEVKEELIKLAKDTAKYIGGKPN